jgi:hypothetical protein
VKIGKAALKVGCKNGKLLFREPKGGATGLFLYLIDVAAMFGCEDDDQPWRFLDSVNNAICTYAEGPTSSMRAD